jgi:hypothetical protein
MITSLTPDEEKLIQVKEGYHDVVRASHPIISESFPLVKRP